MTNLA